MLKILRDSRTAKRAAALRAGDLDTLAKLQHKTSAEDLSQPLYDEHDAVEFTILTQQPKSLAWVLRIWSAANGSNAQGEPYLVSALRQPNQSLALISTLLAAGGDANLRYQERSLMQWCLELCESSQLMLHINRLVQHGASIETDPSLVSSAIARKDQALIHFMINSGAPFNPEQLDADSDAEMVAYAKRCAEDKKIREMMLTL